MSVKVKMLRAVGGFEVGDTRQMSQADAERLAGRGTVKILGKKAQGAAEKNKAEGAAEKNKGAISGVRQGPRSRTR